VAVPLSAATIPFSHPGVASSAKAVPSQECELLLYPGMISRSGIGSLLICIGKLASWTIALGALWVCCDHIYHHFGLTGGLIAAPLGPITLAIYPWVELRETGRWGLLFTVYVGILSSRIIVVFGRKLLWGSVPDSLETFKRIFYE
jgi:hypothetical protein